MPCESRRPRQRRSSLGPFFRFPDFSPPALVGAGCCRGGAIDPIHATHFDFFRRWFRGAVFVERARVGLPDVRVQDAADDDRLMTAEAAADGDRVAFADGAVRLGVFAVYFDLAALTRALGFRTCLEQAGDVQPDVQANRRRLQVPGSTFRVDVRVPRSRVRVPCSGAFRGQIRISTFPFDFSDSMKACVFC
jgi:hypothetical protein